MNWSEAMPFSFFNFFFPTISLDESRFTDDGLFWEATKRDEEQLEPIHRPLSPVWELGVSSVVGLTVLYEFCCIGITPSIPFIISFFDDGLFSSC